MTTPTPIEQVARTPADYAIEHAGYLATAAKEYRAAVGAEIEAQMAHEEHCTPETESKLNAAIDAVGGVGRQLEIAIYEFEKRRDRALAERAQWRHTVAMAYAHLWHTSSEPAAPVPMRSGDEAAIEARKLLLGVLTNQERAQAIQEVGQQLGRYEVGVQRG